MRAIALALLLVAVVATTSTTASDLDVAALQWQQQEIDLAVAPVKSRADLELHLRTAPDSPFAKLPPAARKAFIDSLVFTKEGLGSYSWLPIAGALDLQDTYRLLALFGLQSDASHVSGVQPATEVERHMVDVSPLIQSDWSNKVCVIQAPYPPRCEPQYGSGCSRACD